MTGWAGGHWWHQHKAMVAASFWKWGRANQAVSSFAILLCWTESCAHQGRPIYYFRHLFYSYISRLLRHVYESFRPTAVHCCCSIIPWFNQIIDDSVWCYVFCNLCVIQSARCHESDFKSHWGTFSAEWSYYVEGFCVCMKKRKRSVHVFMCTCHRAAGIAESRRKGRPWRGSRAEGGGNGRGRTGEERTARDGEARWRGSHQAKKKTKQGQQVRGGRGHRHKDAAAEPLNNFIARSDASSPSESEGKKKSWRTCLCVSRWRNTVSV